MPVVTEDAVLGALRGVKDPDLGRDIVALGFVKDVKICGGQVGFTIELTTPACPVREQLKAEAARLVGGIPGVETVNVKMTAQVRPTMAERAAALIPQVKNVVPVASGKGGVGKSTVAVNLALALAQTGARVGLMDADVYGPSVPTILGITEPIMARANRFVPAERYGIKAISTASMIPPGRAAILRGPMLHKVIEQFLGQTDWGDLDYLIVDLPPGTGDIHLSLCQMIPLTGAAIVSTPQDVALKVAEKAIFMFQQLRTPVLGIVENMSYFTCEHGTRYEIFGHGGAQRYCVRNGIPFLGEIPLATRIRSTSDEGRPVVVSDPDSEYSQAFLRVAKNLAAQISVQAMEGSAMEGQGLKRLEQPSRREIVLEWKDGHVSRYDPFTLRMACACATCVDENTGRKLLHAESVPKDVWACSISPVGRYGLQFVWSDGHSTGIYTFDRLRSMCPCCGQKA